VTTLFLPALRRRGLLPHLTVMLVGSRKLPQFGETTDWWHNVFGDDVTIVGVEADAAACDAMNREMAERGLAHQEKHHAVALWDEDGEQDLYVTAFPGCSSLLRPDQDYMSRRESHKGMMRVVGTQRVPTMTIESFAHREGIGFVDYLGLDVQGAAGRIVRSGCAWLWRNVLVAAVEADWVRAYEGASLFHHVWQMLAVHGFVMGDLLQPHRGSRAAFRVRHPDREGPPEWSDALFWRDIVGPSLAGHPLATPERVLRLAALADGLGYVDVAGEHLVWLAEHARGTQWDPTEVLEEVLAAMPDQAAARAHIPWWAAHDKR
jgi:FkbM family methyltransferase